MGKFYILMELLVASLITLMAQKSSETMKRTIKYPHPITINGIMQCDNKKAYAVLINSIEEVQYIKYGSITKSLLRTSPYYLSERNGEFRIIATRYVGDHKLYLNITHHCIPDDKRNVLKNCFMQVMHEIKDDLRAVRFDLPAINLENIHYQSNIVKCVDWPYKHPEFSKTNYSNDL